VLRAAKFRTAVNERATVRDRRYNGKLGIVTTGKFDS